MTTTTKPRSEGKWAIPERHVSSDDIAHRAFELYSARGCEDGHDLDDWLHAERELTGVGATSREERLRATSSVE